MVTVKYFTKALCILVLIEFVFYVAHLPTGLRFLSSRLDQEEVTKTTTEAKIPNKAGSRVEPTSPHLTNTVSWNKTYIQPTVNRSYQVPRRRKSNILLPTQELNETAKQRTELEVSEKVMKSSGWERLRDNTLEQSTSLYLTKISRRNDQVLNEQSTVEVSKSKTKVDLFIAILSAPQRVDRRHAMRETWLSTVPYYSVAFRFFTDGIELSNETKTLLSKEREEFGDLELLPTKGGYWFSHRFLHALFWAHKHYNFSYFLRMDDDYFLCLHHLYHDLKHRKNEKFLFWGWFWCEPKAARMDEGFIVFGADLTQEIIRRNNSLYCHPFGDQMIAIWVNRLEMEGVKAKYFPDNARLMQWGLKTASKNMCQGILGIHKTYPHQMRLYWNLTKSTWFSSPETFRKIKIKKYSKYCHNPRGFDWRVFGPFYGHEPKPCWEPGVHWPKLDSLKLHAGDQPRQKEPGTH